MEGLKDARTFLRNVLPGLAIAIEFIVFAASFQLLDIDKEPTKSVWAFLSKDSSSAIVGAAGLLFASGALGYIVSNVYHVVLNYVFFWFFSYRGVLRSLAKDNKLRAYQLDGTQINFNEIWFGRRRDWAILTAMWAERRDKSPEMKAATERAEQLVNVVHGAGTLFLGSLIAWIAAALWADSRNGQLCYPAGGLFGLILVLSHWVSLQWTALTARDFITTIIGDQVRKEVEDTAKPVTVYYGGPNLLLPRITWVLLKAWRLVQSLWRR